MKTKTNAARATAAAKRHFADSLLDAIKPIVKGLHETLGTTTEVVLHDFRRPESSIVAISGSITSRHVGGAMSEIGLGLLSQGNSAQDKINYSLRTPSGRTIRSSTILLRDNDGDVVGAFCLNLDVTELTLAVSALTSLIGQAQPEPSESTVFSDDIGQIIDTVLRQEEQRIGRALPHDTRQSRREVIKALDARGIFNLPRAAHKVAEHLGVSRATVYADLDAVRGVETDDALVGKASPVP